MEYVSKITGLILLRTLNAYELDVADNLLRYTHLPTFLKNCNKADIIVAPTSMIMNCGLFEILISLISKAVMLPVPVPQRLSTDTVETSSSAASILSDLMRKINDPHNPTHVKGIVSAAIGIGINGSVTPGPLAWQLLVIPGVKIYVGVIRPVVTVSYHDRTTNTTRSESAELATVLIEKETSGTELIMIMEKYFLEKDEVGCSRLEVSLRTILLKFPFYNKTGMMGTRV